MVHVFGGQIITYQDYGRVRCLEGGRRWKRMLPARSHHFAAPAGSIGNTNIFYFHPEPWGRWTHFDDHIFQRGWFNHPTRSTFATGCRWTCQVVGCQVPCLTSRFRREAAARMKPREWWKSWQDILPSCETWMAIENPVFNTEYIFNPCSFSSRSLLVYQRVCPLFFWGDEEETWIGDLQWYKKETNWITFDRFESDF